MAKSTATNDDQIIQLKKQIEEKRAQLKSVKPFHPKTNLSIDWHGTRINIHTLTTDALVFMLVEMNALRLAADNINLLDNVVISGFKLTDWMDDVKGKLAHTSHKEEERRLRAMEERLDTLLSDNKKVELELEELRKQI